MDLEALFTELLELAADESRVAERIEIQQATPGVYMTRVYFVGESDFEPLHVGLT